MSGVPVMARPPRTPRTILVLGGGAREDALAWRLARDPGVERILVAPGNPGMTPAAELRPGLDLADSAAVADLAREVGAELVLVGPESPLVGGVADALRAAGLAVFGPSAAAARLEGSKSFCRAVAAAAGVPMAEGAAFTSVGPALEFAERLDGRVVVKADGLAAGKGVTVCADVEEAEDALRASLEGGRFGPAGLRVVVEARLEGPEASLIALCDETAALALPAARDHKRVGDGERGPNTGGMGAYSPVADLDEAAVAELIERIHRPVLAELARRGVAFRGALYAGLILAAEGVRLLEFNVRFGDPEAQALLPRLEGPLAPLLLAAAEGRLAEAATGLGVAGGHLPTSGEAAAAIVLAAAGYPGTPRLGDPISGLERARAAGGLVFGAGIRASAEGRLVTGGGRVLTVVGRGRNVRLAAEAAYAIADGIEFPGRQLRRDIGRLGPPTRATAGSARPSAARPSAASPGGRP